MKFAAELWRKKYKHEGDARLGVIASSGDPPLIIKWLDNIT